MSDQVILACDENGDFTGEYIAKEAGHSGDGWRHLAIAVLLFSSRGEVLLQRRKHRVFGDVWDLTGATHPLHLDDGSDETFEEATIRCLHREYDVRGVSVRRVGAFNYFSRYGALCENEHCALFVGQYDGEVRLNPEVGYAYRWVDKHQFVRDVAANPGDYSPWAVEAVTILKRAGIL